MGSGARSAAATPSIRGSIAHGAEERGALRLRGRRWASVKARRGYCSSVLTGRRPEPQSRSVPGVECCVYNATVYGQDVTLTGLREGGGHTTASIGNFDNNSVLGEDRRNFYAEAAAPFRLR